MDKNAQISIEFIFIVSLVIIFITPIIYYSYDASSKAFTKAQEEEAILTLIKEADIVHSLGPGSKRYTDITLPGGIVNFTIKDRQLFLRTALSGEYNYRSSANLTGELPQSRGTYYMSLESLESGKVLINYSR